MSRGDPRVWTLRNPGWLVVLAAVALSIIGLYAIDVGDAARAADNAPAVSGLALRQAIFIGVGMAAAAIALPHYRWLGYLSVVLMIGVVALLIILLIPAVPAWIVRPRNGARSWINLGVTDLQPSELAKIAYVLVIARYLRYRSSHRRLSGLLPIGVITMVPVGLITLQPDLGTAMLFIPSLFAMLVAAGARLRHLTVIVLIAAAAAPLAYPLLLPHQKARIAGLVKQLRGDRSADQGINFQGDTAQMLIGAGQLAGTPDAKARALIRYSALPERHNDMILAVVVNRFGLWGLLALLTLSMLWTAGALLAAGRTNDPFGRLLAVGLAGFVSAQAAVNLAMNLGLAPIVGVTLPFVSYGGSSMVTMWMMTGLVFSVAAHRPEPMLKTAFEFRDEE